MWSKLNLCRMNHQSRYFWSALRKKKMSERLVIVLIQLIAESTQQFG